MPSSGAASRLRSRSQDRRLDLASSLKQRRWRSPPLLKPMYSTRTVSGARRNCCGVPVLPIVEQLADAAGEARTLSALGGHHPRHHGYRDRPAGPQPHRLDRRRLSETVEALRYLAKAHRDTPMAGRTHLQHALPITFGYKAAVWLSALQRHRERLSQLEPRDSCGRVFRRIRHLGLAR